jgi:hypothetical protein
MSYATSNPPYVMVPAIGGKPALWGYSSADANATVVGTGYFTDGKALGMKVEDFLISTLSSSNQLLVAKVTTVSSTGVTVVAGTLTST